MKPGGSVWLWSSKFLTAPSLSQIYLTPLHFLFSSLTLWNWPTGAPRPPQLLGWRLTKAITVERPELPIYLCMSSPSQSTLAYVFGFRRSLYVESTCHSALGGWLVFPSLLQISLLYFHFCTSSHNCVKFNSHNKSLILIICMTAILLHQHNYCYLK